MRLLVRGVRQSFRKAAILFVLCFVIYCGILLYKTSNSSNLHVDQNLCIRHIHLLCKKFGHASVIGNQCKNVCTTRTLNIKCIQSCQQCKTVITLTSQDGHMLVMKTQPPDEKYEQFTQPSPATLAEALEFLKAIGRDLREDEMATFLSHLDLTEDSQSHRVAETGQSLLAQSEYIMLLRLQGLAIAPKLYGTCGMFYVTQYTPVHSSLVSNNMLSVLPTYPIGSWPVRRRVAVALLELVNRLDKNGLAFCDVKGQNVGFLEDTGVAVLLDVDTVFTLPQISVILNDTQCSHDYDCSFWDCHGECDRAVGRCTGQLVNTNFHAVCQKILSNHISNTWHGLLADVPFKHSVIRQVIHRYCASWRLDSEHSSTAQSKISAELIHDRIKL